ncbi:hypothetical protein, partial [Anabaena sp. UHCC 0451]|uniref:hypothetical protein n=1 Tax=Anabaena sp. UHCC 0451 TaxID=2055235 RepID=UPI002B20FD7B
SALRAASLTSTNIANFATLNESAWVNPNNLVNIAEGKRQEAKGKSETLAIIKFHGSIMS